MNRSCLHVLLASTAMIALVACSSPPESACAACMACPEGELGAPCRITNRVSPAELVGAWVSERSDHPLTLHLHDGGYFTIQARKASGWPGGYALGHWSVKDLKFKGTIETSGIPSLPTSHQWVDTITFVSGTDLVLLTPNGRVEKFSRETRE